MKMTCLKSFLCLILGLGAMIGSSQGGAPVAPVACPAACAMVVYGGISAVEAFLIATGVGAPFAAAIAAAFAGAGAGGLQAAGCATVCLAALAGVTCFDEHSHAEVVLRNGALKQMPMDKLQPGDVVRSLDEEIPSYQAVATVKGVWKTQGHFLFYQFDLDNKGKTAINVTAPHMMILCDNGHESNLTMKPAWDVVAGDTMIVSSFDDEHKTINKCAKVKKVTSFYAQEKINVETDTGTLIANGVFVSGICENHGGEKGDAISMLSSYRSSHGYPEHVGHDPLLSPQMP